MLRVNVSAYISESSPPLLLFDSGGSEHTFSLLSTAPPAPMARPCRLPAPRSHGTTQLRTCQPRPGGVHTPPYRIVAPSSSHGNECNGRLQTAHGAVHVPQTRRPRYKFLELGCVREIQVCRRGVGDGGKVQLFFFRIRYVLMTLVKGGVFSLCLQIALFGRLVLPGTEWDLLRVHGPGNVDAPMILQVIRSAHLPI